MMAAYDAFLCAMPLIMMIKTALCLFASDLDRSNTGVQFASVSRQTTFLVEFNGQVCWKAAPFYFMNAAANDIALYCSYYCLSYHRIYHGPSLGSVQSTTRCLST
jgi:hypothetical protein